MPVFSKSVFSKFSVYQNHLQGLLKYRFGAPPRVSHLVDFGWGLRISISNRLLGDASVAVIGTTL